MSLDFSDFSTKDIKKFKVFWDIVRRRIKISDLKKLYEMHKIITKIQTEKKFRFKDIKNFRPKYIIMAINMHNKYTDREDIDVESFIEAFVELIHKVETLKEENPKIEKFLKRLIKLMNALKIKGILTSILL